MDFITIFQALLRRGIPAFIGGIAFFLLFTAVYQIYRKALHGQKNIDQSTNNQRSSFMLLADSCGWANFIEPWF